MSPFSKLAVLLCCVLPASAVDLHFQGLGPDVTGTTQYPDRHVEAHWLTPDPTRPDVTIEEIRVQAQTVKGHEFLNVNPGGIPSPLRDPLLLGDQIDFDTQLLFDPTQVLVANVVETPLLFEARIIFPDPVLYSVAASSFPEVFLREVVTGFDGSTAVATEIKYTDGSRLISGTFAIPEPSAAMLGVVGLLAVGFRPRRR
jgi:hypothetical protein